MQAALSVDLPHYCFVCVQSLIESQQAIWLPLIQKKIIKDKKIIKEKELPHIPHDICSGM